MRIRMSRMKLLAALAAGLACGLAFLVVFPSCNTPFIPLPPPGDPTFTPVTMNEGPRIWETRGGPSSAMSEARVFVYNIDGGTGVIQRANADGSYVANPIDARLGDRIQIRYESKDGRNSPDICRVLQQGLAQTPCTP
jgi:hypothetical protein